MRMAKGAGSVLPRPPISANGVGSPNDNITALGPYASACSTTPDVTAQARKPTPHGPPASAATIGNSRSNHARSPPPTIPNPPPRDTAAASAPPADPPIGANPIGCRTPNNLVNPVDNAIAALSLRKPGATSRWCSR
jgi:hypothetical protein